MATLTADVTAEQTSWNVSAMPGTAFLQADDEIVRVLDERSTENRIRVQRGYAGTTAATHAADVELVPVYVPSTGSGQQTIRLLESVIDADDVTFTGGEWESAETFPVVAGSWLLEAWIQIPTEFQVAGGTYATIQWRTDVVSSLAVPFSAFQLMVYAEDANQTGFSVATDDVVPVGESYNTQLGTRLDLDDGAGMRVRPLPARIPANCDLFAFLSSDGTAGTSGQVKLYALIAEPS